MVLSAGIALLRGPTLLLPVPLTFVSRSFPRQRADRPLTLPNWEEVMKTHYTVALAMFAGVGIGAVAVHGLHAQAKPPIYYISEIETTNPDAYMKDYAPQAQAVIKAHGGRVLAAGNGTAGGEEAPEWR